MLFPQDEGVVVTVGVDVAAAEDVVAGLLRRRTKSGVSASNRPSTPFYLHVSPKVEGKFSNLPAFKIRFRILKDLSNLVQLIVRRMGLKRSAFLGLGLDPITFSNRNS